MNTSIPFGVLAVVLLLASLTAAGTAAASPETNQTAEVALDENVEIVDWEYVDGTYTVDIRNTGPAAEVTAIEAIDADEGESSLGGIDVTAIARDDRVTITVDAERDLILYTEDSIANERFVALGSDDDTDPLIGGPWTYRDVQLAAFLALLVGVSSVPLVSKIVDSQLQEDRLV